MKRFKSLWDRLLFRDKGVVPTKKLLAYYGVFALVVGILSFWLFSWLFLGIATLLMLALLVIDAFMLPPKQSFKISRSVAEQIERYQQQNVTVHIHNQTNEPYTVRLVDSWPTSFQTNYRDEQLISKSQHTAFGYTITPHQRGSYTLNKLYLRVKTKIGLWEKQYTYSLPQEIKVIPNLAETKRYLASAQKYLLHEGIKVKKTKTGIGDFAKIRSYAAGDDPRKINWRQSAKLQTMMTNEYEPEHGKYITILIDCGRMMGMELEYGNRLEKSIEAAITLAAAALDNGDHVSLIAFSKNIQAVVPPGKGLQHIEAILQAVYSIEVDAQESNYPLALQHAQSIQKKRSMMVLFSDIQTFANEAYPLFYMKQIRKKHLIMMLGIEDTMLHKQRNSQSDGVLAAMEKSVAQSQYLKQQQVMNKWEKHGLPMLEASAERLAATAVSQYIQILNRGLL
ncbi:DUF58 domain-containing protein [Gracilibacillus caseinilyticus]|uniref:DUF58 domain-containing protein n=1 Tax=Gracilibacillus caseinilyticus TaxID=2932256 RepID=A0ABY4EZ74_9BACI|nr:DUF58 domain-containing protein [Gracilibacillus caseinilyticus]UOQ49212.1 DUF58 domain-containing protein [Gracilibacillus caseinilyticus]